MIGIVMFFVALFALLLGFPVAFTFGGIALIFGVWAEGIEMFAFHAISNSIDHGKYGTDGRSIIRFHGACSAKDQAC